MADPVKSSFDPEPSCSNTIILGINEQKVNTIKTRDYRPAPASRKRKREEKNYQRNNIELFKMCKPFSIKLERLPQLAISKSLTKCDQVVRTKRRHRWSKGFADKVRKRSKSEKPTEKSTEMSTEKSIEKSKKSETLEKCSEANNISNSSMEPEHPWGCCRMIPFKIHQSRNHRKSSLSKNRNSIEPSRSQTEVPNTNITEHTVSTMFLRDKKLSQEDKRSSSKSKENETPTDIVKKHDSHSLLLLPVEEKRTSSAKEESTSKTVEDELVCRRILPYTRKTKCKPLLNSPNNAIPQALSSKHSAQSKSVQNHNLKELKQKAFESCLKRETRISETEKYSGCSKTEPLPLKTGFREKEQSLHKLSNNDTTVEIRKRPSKLEFKVCEKTDETKVPEPKVSRDYDNDENVEDNNFTWNSSNMWKYKRKHRIRRISSSSSEEEILRKKPKLSPTVDYRSSSEMKPGPSSTKGKRRSYSGMQTLCPSSCMHTEHQGHINFLYNKPKVRPLKESRVLLQRLEDIKNDLEVIRWRNRLIKLEIEEVEDEEREEEKVERNLEDDEKDSRYHMYDDRTVSNEALREPIYQKMREMTDFDTMGAPYQDYDKSNLSEGQMLSNSTLDMTRYCNNTVDEPQYLKDDICQVNLSKDDEALDDLLRDDDDIPLEFSEYPKVLLIRLENLVGSFETEYSAFEIENLEQKFIDFMMNSNFTYDKQSQSFFAVYKRLHAKRAKDRELEMINRESPFYVNDDASEVHELEETDSQDDYVDEKPLVIALDTEREVSRNVEWVSDVSSNNSASENILPSSVNHDSELATITPLPNDANQSIESPICGNNEIRPIEFVTCENVSKEAESPKEDPLYITCKFCKVSFINLHTFSLHKAECHVKNKQSLMCEYCGNQYKSSRALKLHIQCVHDQDNSVLQKQKTSSKASEKTSSKANDKASNKTNEKSKANENKSASGHQKKKLIPAAQHLSCGVCSVTFESKETLWDHILKHTERELQDAYNDAKKNKDLGLENKVENSKKKKSKKSKSTSKENGEPKKDQKQLPTKYTQWKDRILYKISTNDEADKNVSISQDPNENQAEEIILSSSGSEICIESNKDCEILDINSSASRSSVIKNTKSAQESDVNSSKVVTMCPCHRNDTSTMVNGDMQIEMVLLCNICQVLFRRRDCFEVHYRVNKSCNMDRTSRTPKLFCSYCQIILNSLPEMRDHLKKHAQINLQGHITFLCNICKVMFFGVGSLFYSHWFNHNKDVSFLASRYSFPKLSIVQIVNTPSSTIQNQEEEYLFVAEFVCKECKIPCGSEVDLQKHACIMHRASAQVPVLAPVPPSKTQETAQSTQNVTVRVTCLECSKVFCSKKEYDIHERIYNHLNSIKPQYICVSSDYNEKAYICTQCKTVRMSIEDLKEHWILHRALREKFVCANCPELRSSSFEEIETHCKSCFKNLVAVCVVVLVLASHECKSCNLHFETSNEWKEHRLMCLPSPLSQTTCIRITDLGNDPSNPPVLPSVIDSVESSVSSAAPPPAPSAVVSSVPPTLSSSDTTSSPSLIPLTKATSTAVSVTPSLSPTNNTNPVLSKPASSKPKFTSVNLLKKYLSLSSTPATKSKKKHQVSQDVEIIDILSESSSRSSVAEDHRKKNPVLNTYDEPSTLEIDPFESYIPGNLKNKHRQKDASLSKSVVCYPPKRKNIKIKSKPTPTKVPTNTTNTQENTISVDSEKTSLAMTVVNPEFEFLLSELENLEKSTEPLKKSNTLRNIRKKSTSTEFNHETSLLNTRSAENSPNIFEDASSSVVSETSSSSKKAEKETPLPFEVVLLQDEDADSLKSGAVSQISTAQVDINSNKSTNPENAQIDVPDQFTNNNSTSSDKDTPSETNTASIIEEYIEYIMMDEAAGAKSPAKVKDPVPDNPEPVEVTSKVEKVAPLRLRVRSLAELQEIKMHLCDYCGQSFDSREKFEEHTQLHCGEALPADFLQHPPPPYREPIQNSRPQTGNSNEIDYREALTQNLVRRGVIPANKDFVPSLLPFTIQELNSSTSKANMTPVSPNIVIPDTKRKQPQATSLLKNQQTYSNNTGVIIPSSTSRFNTSGSNSAPRSGTIQLPERTGVSVLQKRPSGAATRIQNLSHSQRSMTPSVIQHHGLPQVYASRQSGKISNSLGSLTRPPRNYTSGGSMSIQPGLENPSSSLTCETCNFTAKSLPEFSSHLIMHYVENSTEQKNHNVNHNHLQNHNQLIEETLRNSPNTSRCQTLSLSVGDVINEKSASASGNWQTPPRYVYACQLCDFRTESKASIRLHEKNHSTVAVMRQKNLERLQNHQMIQQTFQTQQQQQQQSQMHFVPTFSQLIETCKPSQPATLTNHDKNGVSLYSRVSGDIFQCQLCNQFLFKSQEEFNRHLNSSHKETRKEVVIETADSSTVCFVCDYCETPQIFESEVNLRKHMNFLHNHVCQICSLRCTSRELLQSHVLSHKLENQT